MLSFFIAAVISIFVILYRKIRKNKDEYIPFGPFLVLATFVVMFVGDGFVLRSFLSFCKLISSQLMLLFM